MDSDRHPSVVLALLLGMFLLLPSISVADAVQTGTLIGVVADSAGLPLPGVEVRLTGPQTRRQALTDDAGRFRFQQLDIGSYEVTASLLGLQAEARDQRVYIAKTTEVRLTLQEASARSSDSAADVPVDASTVTREQIQVLAVAPLIDRFETGVRTSVSREFLEQLPVERFYQSVALLLPGVAGGEDGNPNTSGSLRDANLFLIDGVDTTDPTTGLFGLNLSYDGVKEVDVTTAAPSVEFGRSSGAIINVVTHSGDNAFKGSARWIASSEDWNSDYGKPEGVTDSIEIDAANSGPNQVDNTFAASLSGPVVEDYVWFYGVFEDGQESFSRPTVVGDAWNENVGISSSAVKLDAQFDRHSLVGQFTVDDAAFDGFEVFNRDPGENRASRTPRRLRQEFLLPFPGDIFALERRSQKGEFVKLDWSTVVNQNLALAARYATQDRRLDRRPSNSRTTNGAPHYIPTSFALLDDEDDDGDDGDEFIEEDDFALFNGITDEGQENRQRDQGSLSVDRFFRIGKTDHELRFGVDYQNTESDRTLNVSGQDGIDRLTGRATQGQLFFDADFRPECLEDLDCVPFDPETGEFQPFFLINFWSRPKLGTEQETLALHLSDAMSFGRWLLSFGLRWDQVSGQDLTGRKLVDDDAISPRFAVKYDAKGDGSVLLSAAYSKFVEPFPQRLLDDFSRAEAFSGFTEYVWAGALGAQFEIDDNEELLRLSEFCLSVDPSELNSPCWLANFVEPFFMLQNASPNLSLKRSAVEELVLGFERQLTPTTALRLNLIDRKWQDLWDDRLVLAGPGDDPFEVGAVFTLENLPEARRRYQAVQLLVQKRFAHRWQMLGSFTWSESEGNLFRSTGRSSFLDFSDFTDTNVINRFGNAPYDRGNQLKLFATYRQPVGWGDLSFGTAVLFEDGVPYQGERFEEFGIRFVNPRGNLRLEDRFQWDLSVTLDLALSQEMEVDLKFEIFNVTDQQTVTAVETDVDSERFAMPRGIDDLQRPRNYRVTLGFRF